MKKAIGKLFLRMGEKMALGYDAGETSRMRKDLGWGRASPRDEDSLVGNDNSRETIRLKGADLRRNNPIVAGVCERLASFTVGTGIIPQAKTTDAAWNAAAEDFFAQWSKVCDSRGRATLVQFQRMAVSLRPTHGGIYLELLANGQIRPIECERIRQPTDPKEAKNYVDGCKVDPVTGRILGYKVHGRDDSGGFGGKHKERFVPASDMVAVVRHPWRPDQVREIPDLAPVVPALTDIGEMNTYTLNTAKAQSQYIAVLKKLSGQGLNSGTRTSGTPVVGQRQTWRKEWGEILESFPGEDLDLKVSPTPNATHIPYVKLQLMLAAAALDLPYEFFTLDFSTADFSRQKAILLLVNKTIRGNWQAPLNQDMNQRLWNWRIAKAMNDGDLPQAPLDKKGVSQWFRVDWQPPEEPWSDRQEAQQADLLETQMGLGTLFRASKRRGFNFEDNIRDNAKALAIVDKIAQETGIDASRLFHMQIPGQTQAATDPNATTKATEGTLER